MGKKNKRKRHPNGDDSKSPSSNSAAPTKNPLLQKQLQFIQGLTELERNEFFSSSITPDRRAELWMKQADFGEELINQYSWAIPSPEVMSILKEFSPLVEIGCGANAYWSRLMRQDGIDVVAYDVNIQSGGKINNNSKSSKKKGKSGDNGKDDDDSYFLKQGGPSMLASKEIQKSNRTLFLCYPDEEDAEGNDDEDDEEHEPPLSMGAQCLEHYRGTHVIHVGELFLDANLSMDQAPWGRSSAPEFQQRLASEYHCLLKVALPNWLHVRDTISVWKRSETSTIVFAAENDDSDDEEVEYRHIPMTERLPTNMAAPCLAHLLPSGNATGSKQKKDESPIINKLDENSKEDFETDEKVSSAQPKKKKNKNKFKRSVEDKQVEKAASKKEDTNYVCPW